MSDNQLSGDEGAGAGTGESGTSGALGDARGAWYYCFKHGKVETRDECHLKDRMGPYPTRADAEHWRERVAARNDAWDDGEDGGE
jgi:hypothetical protein